MIGQECFERLLVGLLAMKQSVFHVRGFSREAPFNSIQILPGFPQPRGCVA
jgi:hypothetical protein